MRTLFKNKVAQIMGVIALLALCIALLLLLSPRYGISAEEEIAQYLSAKGFDVAGITFTKEASDDLPWYESATRYTSSAPVDYWGEEVSYWTVDRYSYGMSGVFSGITVEPYPAVPDPIDIDLTLTQKEYMALQALAGDGPVEEYIKELIDSASENNA